MTVFIRCADCKDKHKPLKWYKFWNAWLCHQCKEARIKKEVYGDS